MQLPLADPDTLFEELLPDLPPETGPMAREFKAFARARKIKTPEQLLRAVLLYWGVDKALREVQGNRISRGRSYCCIMYASMRLLTRFTTTTECN
jgi:hypothetical protein